MIRCPGIGLHHLFWDTKTLSMESQASGGCRLECLVGQTDLRQSGEEWSSSCGETRTGKARDHGVWKIRRYGNYGKVHVWSICGVLNINIIYCIYIHTHVHMNCCIGTAMILILLVSTCTVKIWATKNIIFSLHILWYQTGKNTLTIHQYHHLGPKKNANLFVGYTSSSSCSICSSMALVMIT